MKPSPARIAARAISALENAANPEYATQTRRYFKPDEDILAHGVKAPLLREIVREVYAQARSTWSPAEAVELCAILMSDPYIEARLLGILFLNRFRRDFDPELLRTAVTWLQANRCDNWGLTDALSTLVVTPLLEKFPALLPELMGWTRSENLWLRRSAAVSLTSLARHGRHLDASYEIVEALLPYKEDLIHKAAGWLLREAGKTDPGRLEAFLRRLGPEIPRTTLRYAIEKFPPEKRKALLAATR